MSNAAARRYATPLVSTRTGSMPTPRDLGAARTLFALTMIALGVLGLAHDDFALVWQRIPIDPLPARGAIAYAVAVIEFLLGIGLLVRKTAPIAAASLAVFLLAWLVLLKSPAVIAVPTMEATWLGFGEIAVLFAGGWILYIAEASDRSAARGISGAGALVAARVVFALALPTIGLSHFVYLPQTVAFVPSWLPAPAMWAYLTGAGSIVACVAMLLGLCPRLAATLEAAMLTIITLLVWAPKLFVPYDRTNFTGFAISLAIAAGAWVVAASYRADRWLARHPITRP